MFVFCLFFVFLLFACFVLLGFLFGFVCFYFVVGFFWAWGMCFVFKNKNKTILDVLLQW